MSQSFDFIDFMDDLQPHLDALQTICSAINGVVDGDDGVLPCLKVTLEYHIDRINDLCERYLKMFKGERS